jgi:hypothetical protein
MTVKITQMALEVSGQVTRKYDADEAKTTLVLTEAQAREAYEALGTVLSFFTQQRRLIPVGGAGGGGGGGASAAGGGVTFGSGGGGVSGQGGAGGGNPQPKES